MAYKFDGSNDFVTVADSPDWDFGTGDFSSSFRVMFNAGGVVTYGLLDVGNGRSSGVSTEYSFTNGRWEIYINGTEYDLTQSVNLSQWYQVNVVRVGTNLSLYVDASQVGATQSNAGNISIADTVKIGDRGTASQPVNGWMSNVAIWKGLALNQQEITQIYQSNQKNLIYQIQPSSLVLFVPLDDFSDGINVSGTGSVKDRSSHNNNGSPADVPIGASNEYLSY